MVYRSKQKILNRRISHEQGTLKKMFNFLSHQGNANANDSEIPPVRRAKIRNTSDRQFMWTMM